MIAQGLAMQNRGMSAACLFCQIASHSRAASIVFEDDHGLAFLDHRPLFPGHCLLIPKTHVETLADLPRAAVEPLFMTAQLLTRALEEGLNAEGTLVAINNRVSQSVPHLHIHVVPRHRKDGLKGFFWPRGKYQDAAHMAMVQETLERTMFRLKPPPQASP
jgi:histidine triad (HIT) family protein